MDNHTFKQLKKVVDNRKAEYEENYLDQSRNRLVKIIEKKIMTVGVGAIATFEEEFGHLWGLGLDQSKLTERQVKWKEVWIEVRNEILNRTNDQVRAVYNEFKQYAVKWNRYKTNLKVKDEDANGNQK